MFTPLSNEVYQESRVEAAEHPACELFPASRGTGRLFGLGVALGFTGLFLDGLNTGMWSWVAIVLAGLVLLLAGGKVVRD